MTHTHRSRSRRKHPDANGVHDAAGLVSLADETTDPDERALLLAKARLAAQLERLDDPLDAAFEVLTPAEFTSLVWRLPNPGRMELLRDLRMPPAKKPTPLAATNGLAQLHQWPAAKRLKAARFVTSPIMRGLAEPLGHWWLHRDDAALTTALVEDTGQANAVRLMVLALWYEMPDVVAALRVALTEGLALPTWPAEVVDGIVDACSQLESLWMESLTGQEHDDSDPEPVTDDGRVPAGGSLRWNAAGAADNDAGGIVPDVTSPAVEQPRLSAEPSPVETPVVPADGLTTAANQVRSTLEAARASARRITNDLEEARVPSSDLLTPIVELDRAVEHGRTLLASGHADID